ncbi:hypothetical protein [Stutzerimonas chloritidismutans]
MGVWNEPAPISKKCPEARVLRAFWFLRLAITGSFLHRQATILYGMVEGIDRAQCLAQAEYHAAFFSRGMVSKTYILLILKRFMYTGDWFLSMVFLQEEFSRPC